MGERPVEQYTKLVEACAEHLEALAVACPHNQYRITRGLQLSSPLGPDDVEQWALEATGLPGGVQLRFQALAASQVRSVPGGLDPLQHWQLGQAVTSPPLDQEMRFLMTATLHVGVVSLLISRRGCVDSSALLIAACVICNPLTMCSAACSTLTPSW